MTLAEMFQAWWDREGHDYADASERPDEVKASLYEAFVAGVFAGMDRVQQVRREAGAEAALKAD